MDSARPGLVFSFEFRIRLSCSESERVKSEDIDSKRFGDDEYEDEDELEWEDEVVEEHGVEKAEDDDEEEPAHAFLLLHSFSCLLLNTRKLVEDILNFSLTYGVSLSSNSFRIVFMA